MALELFLIFNDLSQPARKVFNDFIDFRTLFKVPNYIISTADWGRLRSVRRFNQHGTLMGGLA